MRRVVVTGMGAVTGYGGGVEALWSGLCSGQSSVVALGPEFAGLPSRVGSLVTDKLGGTQDDLRRHTRATQFALEATHEALQQAQWDLTLPHHQFITGASIGTGIAGLEEIETAATQLASGQARRISPYFVPKILSSMVAGAVSVRYGLMGPSTGVSSACATGAHCIGDAMRYIQHGDAQVMIAGGTEACVLPLAVTGFSRLKALSTRFNDRPCAASRPFDTQRDGFVIGEGAGVMVLEDRDHAIARGAPILAELAGYGSSGDGHHLTAPREDGLGAYLAANKALAAAQIAVDEVRCVNAHATSTPQGDLAELVALDRLFKTRDAQEPVWVTANKGGLGHLLGAAGAVEAIVSVVGLNRQEIPPCINLEHLDPAAEQYRGFRFPSSKVRVSHGCVLTNSFGFGGTNASLVFRSP